MKILKKIPNINADRDAELIKNKWNPLREPKSVGSAILLSIPFIIINALISLGIINIFSSVSLSEFGIQSNGISVTIDLSIIFWLFLLLVMHEFFHLILIPNFAKSEKTFAGITLFGGFVVTEEEIARTRFILITVAPFVVISIILPILLGIFGLLTTTMKFLIILNAMASSVDLLTFFLVISQVPKNATLISNGPKTYWKSVQKG